MSESQHTKFEKAVAHCRTITRQRARNFYWGLKLTPQPQRNAMYVLYTWTRLADDLADEGASNPAKRHKRLEEFRSATDDALDGSPTDADPMWFALAEIASQFPLPRGEFHRMIDGQIADLGEKISYPTFDDLEDFCRRVASSVGVISITIWGYAVPEARKLAIDRGLAFQLTNILRDYREDFDANRVYLPDEDFKRHNLTPRQVRTWDDPENCEMFIREQAYRAQSYYDRSAGLAEMITSTCRPSLWAMTTIYHGLLEKIIEDPSRIVSDRRIRLSSFRKAMIGFRAKRLASAEQSSPEVEAAGAGAN